MTKEHRDNKRVIDSVRSLSERRELIYRCALDEIDTRILILRHAEFKPFDFIADTVGLSMSAVRRRYRRAAEILSDIIRSGQ